MSHLPPLVDFGAEFGLAVCGQTVRACSHRAGPPGKGLGHIHAAGRQSLVVGVNFFGQRGKGRRHAHGLYRAVKGLGHQITVPGLVYAIVEDRAAHEEILPRDHPGGNGIRPKGELPGNGVVRPVKEIVRQCTQLRNGHAKSPPCRSDRFTRGNGLDRDAVQILSEQGHAHNGEALRDCGVVVALSVEADEVACLARSGVDQTGLGKVAVGGVNIVQDDVVHRGCDDLSTRDLAAGKQEDGVVAHEVFDVLETELVLNGDVGRAQVLVHIQNVGEAHDAGDGAVHVLELVLNTTLCHRQSHLEGLGGTFQGAGVQVLVEAVGDVCGQLVQELVIGLLNGDIVAILLDGFQRDGFGELFDSNVSIGLFFDGELAVGDFLALSNSAALKRTLGVLALEGSAGLHPNGAHDAHDVAQMLPVALEAGDEVDFSGVDGNVGSYDKIFFCCHVLFLSAACKEVGICSNRGLTFASILDCKDLVFGHFGAGVGGRVVHLCAGGFGGGNFAAPCGFDAGKLLFGVFYIAIGVQFQPGGELVALLGVVGNVVDVLFQHSSLLEQLLKCSGLGRLAGCCCLLSLVVGQRLFCGLLAAVGCIPVLLGLCAGCFFCIQLVLEFVRLLVQGVQNGLGLVIVGGFGVLQNRADVSSFECHVIVLSALARAAMLGNKV
nr:MAG TPA: hypothetical protein [Caudoviricetes sp.]